MNRSLLRNLWFVLVCLSLATSPWLGGQWSGVGPAVARSLVAAAGLAWIVEQWGHWRLPRGAAWLWAFAAWSIITVVPQTNLHASLLALGDLVTFATLFVLAADASDDDIRRPLMLCAVFASCAVAAGMGIAHAFESGPGWREFGPFVTPNIFASYLVTVLPVAFLMAVRNLRKDSPESDDRRTPANVACVMLGILAMATGFTALLLTGSKGALGALVVAVVAVFTFARPWRKVRTAMVSMAILIVVFATVVGGRTVKGRVESAQTTEAHSSQFRVLTWKGAARMAAANPITGTGIGTFGAAFNRYAIAGWTQAAHNAYLQTAAETGIPGVILFLLALGTAAIALGRRSRVSLVAAGALAGLVAAALHNGVDYGWSLWAPAAIMWSLIGIGVGTEDRLRAPKWSGVLMAVALAATLVFSMLVANASAVAEAALDHSSSLSPAQRVEALRSARGLDPLDGLLAREMGIALAQAGDSAGATQALQDATRLSPNDAVAWRLLGEGSLSGDGSEARAAFTRGLTVAPNSVKLLLDAARLEESTGRRDAALDLYRRLVVVAEGPVGQYSATPELVDAEPLFAYAALADDADKRGDREAAVRNRRSLIALADRYARNREQYTNLWRATGKDDPRDLAEVQDLRARAQVALTGNTAR